MIFTSQIFLFWFLPAVLLSYYVLPFRFRSALLVLASYVFYGWWRLDFVLLMLVSTIIDFVCGNAIARTNDRLDAIADPDAAAARELERKRRRVLLVSICANLGLLGYFKYMNFGIDSLNLLLARFGLDAVSWTKVVLPVGISFYTFQSMSYTIDVYRRDAPAVRRFVDFAAYIALFPQLVAGPIIRYRTLADQLRSRTHTFDKVSRGAFLFQAGFIKKLLLADTIAVIADASFSAWQPSTLEAWLGTFAYSMQIYFDFSGYSDMAIGLGAMLGFQFPINFHSPYKSRNVTEFWRRWHISLSTWLRDYLYIPMGGNQKGPRRTYLNLMVTMLLGGLWHGAAWTFVAWGAYQGAFLAFERFLGKRAPYSRLPVVLQIALTFVIVLGGWVFFRASSFGQAYNFLAAMGGFCGNLDWTYVRFEIDPLQMIALVACPLIAFSTPNSQEIVERGRFVLMILISLLFPFAVCHLFFVTYSPFLYFRF